MAIDHERAVVKRADVFQTSREVATRARALPKSTRELSVRRSTLSRSRVARPVGRPGKSVERDAEPGFHRFQISDGPDTTVVSKSTARESAIHSPGGVDRDQPANTRVETMRERLRTRCGLIAPRRPTTSGMPCLSDGLDGASRAGRVGKSTVGGEERATERFGQADVARVVRRDVVPQRPGPAEQWPGWVHDQRKAEEVLDRRVRLPGRQQIRAGLAPDHGHDLDAKEVRTGDGLASESRAERVTIGTAVGDDGGDH